MVAANSDFVTAAVPPASPFEGGRARADRPAGTWLAFSETTPFKFTGWKAKPTAEEREALRPAVDEGDGPAEHLSPEAENFLFLAIRPYVCNEAWAWQLVELLRERLPDGRPLVPVAMTDRGLLVTKVPALMRMLAALEPRTLAWPPPADDVPHCRLAVDDRGWRTGTYHRGSMLRPCGCIDCTTATAGRLLHALWPAYYTVGRRAYDCIVARAAIDPAAALLDPDLAELWNQQQAEPARDRPAGGRYVTPAEVAAAKVYDAEAWRHDRVALLGLDDDVAHALRRHRWTTVEGDVEPADGEGRERSTVRVVKRHLGDVGSVADFIDLGRDLAKVVGAAAVADVVAKVAAHPREGRMVEVRVREG